MSIARQLAALSISLGGLLAITAPAPVHAQARVPMVLISQSNEAGFPLWLANKLNYFADAGIDAKIQYFPNGGAALASGAAGDWQGGWIGSPPAITGWAKFGLIPAGTMMKEDRNIKLIQRKDALKGSSPKAVLESKPIGSVPNSTWSQVLYACAKHFGADPDKMKVVPLAPPVTRQSLRSGEVASGMTDSSPDYDLVMDKQNFQVSCDGDVAKSSVIDPYVVTSRFAKANPQVAAKFIEAAFRANELIMSDREKAVKYLLEFYKDVGIDGDETKARYTLGYRDYQTLDQALADLKSGATEKALTDTAQVFVAGGPYDKVPDLKGAVAAALPIVEAAKALRK